MLSVSAHTQPIGHSCLSPDGTTLFTIANQEEAMKMWKVWGKREKVQKENMFDTYRIR